jgi:hypothetical protein
MTYKLFIDDERFPATTEWVIVRSSEEAKDAVRNYGIPRFISFDHDLGGDDTSMAFIHWLIKIVLDSNGHMKFPAEYYIHSQNPVGAANIKSLMDSAITHLS